VSEAIATGKLIFLELVVPGGIAVGDGHPNSSLCAANGIISEGNLRRSLSLAEIHVLDCDPREDFPIRTGNLVSINDAVGGTIVSERTADTGLVTEKTSEIHNTLPEPPTIAPSQPAKC